MLSCFLPDNSWWIIPPTLGALLGALLALTIGHGVIQAMMETRGVAPWGKRDSLSAMPLYLLGAMLLGAASALGAVTVLAQCRPAFLLVLVVPIVGGLVCLRLGTLALRRMV